MAISANAVTLAQYALMSNSPLVQAVTMSLIDNGSVMQDIPFVTKQTLVANGVRFTGNLPTVNWAKINEEGATTSATPSAFQEQAYVIRNYIDTDKLLVQDQNQIADPRGIQLAAFLKAASYDFNFKFIENDHSTGDSDAFVGIRERIDSYTAWGVNSANKIDAGGAVITQAATAAQANAFLEWLDQLLWSVDAPDGNGVVLYMNDVMVRRLHYLMRLLSGGGGFATTTDQFDRVILRYKGALIRDIGYKADQSTRIITITEAATGLAGSSDYTSIYAVNYSMDHLFGWQFAPLDARDLGLMENGVIYRTMIDWAGGLYNAHTRSMARLYDLKIK